VHVLFRILLAIISGASTYFAFPFIYVLLVEKGLGHGIFGVEILTYTVLACIVVSVAVFSGLRRRDIKKIRMSRAIQGIIALIAIFPVLVLYAVISPLNPLNLWSIIIYQNLFYFSTIVLTSLFYLLKGDHSEEKGWALFKHQ